MSLNPLPLDATAGVSNLIQQVCRLSKGLRLLNLSKTSLTSKGLDPPSLMFLSTSRTALPQFVFSNVITVCRIFYSPRQ